MWSIWSKTVLPIFFCFAFFGPIGHSQFSSGDDECQTPEQEDGNCIPVAECTHMVNILKTLKRPISQTTLKRLQSYNCGQAGSSYKVCCPPGPISLDSNDKAKSQNREKPPDVTNHKNLHLLPKKCGRLDPHDKIVNGEDALLNEFPWMALLRYEEGRSLSFNCGGTIINKNYILTAAHCVTGLKTSELVSVRVGEYSIKNETDCETINHNTVCNPPFQDLEIEEIIPHLEFGPRSYENDIALIRVSTMDFNMENASPVCLPVDETKDRPFESVYVAGWGLTNSQTRDRADILQKVALPVADKQMCAANYKESGVTLTNSQICAGGVDGKASCSGDSGGPIMAATRRGADLFYVQHGIVSIGPSYCGIRDYPGIYTLIKFYRDWILDNMKP